MLLSAVVLRNASAPMVVTLAGIVTDVIPVELNASSSIVTRALSDSNVTEASAVASANANSSIVLTRAGIVIEVSEDVK